MLASLGCLTALVRAGAVKEPWTIRAKCCISIPRFQDGLDVTSVHIGDPAAVFNDVSGWLTLASIQISVNYSSSSLNSMRVVRC